MESSQTGWWRRHGWTVVILLSAFGISFAIRTIWAYPIIAQWGPLFTYGGGSDSYYHSRVMTYTILNHRNLIFDPELSFPTGGINPREPLFDWMNAILGIVFAPFFGGNAVTAGAWFLDLQAPLWAALGVFPVYLIGREVSDRRTGLIAATIFPFLSGNIDSSIFGYANYLSFYTFVILVVVYSYLRTVKAAGTRRWVEDYRHPREYLPALRAFARTERSAVKWAVFTGVSLGTLALAWQGYTYGVVVISISLVVAMVIERIRRVDSFGLYVSTAIVGLVGFPMAMPYYIVQRQFTTWFDLPLLLFFGTLAVLLPFLLMRDVPWVFSVPFLAILVGAAVGLLDLVNPVAFSSLVTGQGYFVKNLIYSTVAEAQAPSIDQLVLAYGVVTFFLAFAGLAIFVYLFARGRFKRQHVVFLVFALLSLYLPISAAKFFLVASPIFALLPALALRRALDIAGYDQLRRTTASLADRRSQFSAFRKAFKPRHVLVMALVLAVVLPNVWVAIDAGIPGNTKAQYGAQVGATLPSWFQLNTSSPASYYFGAAGGSLDTPNEYDSAGYNWLAQQDTNLPAAQRPAFVSWWDYGFQAIDQGQHPSVADNFQHGIDPAGQFLLSQNESQAIGVLITTLLQTEQRTSGVPDLPPSLNAILAADGLNMNELHNLLVNTSSDYTLVVAHPERYLPVNPGTITDDNAMYLAMEYFLATSLPLSGVAKVYNDVQAYTGWSIRYAMTDSRLFPFSGTSTGIFYAPADLTGRIIDRTGQPATFFNLSVLGSDGHYYPYGNLPSGVTPVGSPVVNYYAPFYNSMIYRIYIGYNGTDAGLGPGIPGLSLNASVEPGWMLQHFQVVYKTAYLCSQPQYAGTCVATNVPQAVAVAKTGNRSADTRPFSYFSGGESMLEYYPGQLLVGTVLQPNGAPVGGVRATVYDQWGIPHQTALTSPYGAFSLVLPPGNDTVNLTMGSLDALTQAGSIPLKSVSIPVPNAFGLGLNAPNLAETFTLGSGSISGFVYWQNTNTTSYTSGVDTLIPHAQVVFSGPNLTRYTATTDASGSFDLPSVSPGVYQYSVLYGGRNYSQSSVTVSPGSNSNATARILSAVVRGTTFEFAGKTLANAVVTLAGPGGTSSNLTTNSTGKFRLSSFGPGNYTLSAYLPNSNLRSEGVLVPVSSNSANFSENLTLRPTGATSFVLTSNGVPASGVAVRFTPTGVFSNASVSPLSVLSNDSRNSTVVVSSPSGSVTAYLPAGQYSVYASGMVNGQLAVGVATTSVTAGASGTPVPLALSPSMPFTGTVTSTGGSAASAQTAVLAFSSTGDQVVTFAAKGGGFSFSLPAGTYSLLALQGPAAGSGSVSAALAQITTPGARSVVLTPVSALRSDFTVAAPLPNGGTYPASGADVVVSAGASGPGVSAVADANGTVAVYLPSVLPLSAGSYCVATSAFGFTATSQCDLSPTGLAALTQVPTSLGPVAVTLTVIGLPSGTTVTVNFSAESETAVDRSLTGGPSFALNLPPGVYGVGARAVLGGGPVVYLPTTTLSTTIPLGATTSRLTLFVVPQVNASGTLVRPAGVPATNVTVTLSSPLLNVSVNGTAFASGFYVAPGTYSAYARATSGGTTYASLSRVTVASDGVVSPSIVLSVAGVTLTGTLTSSATGSTVHLTAAVRLVAPDGAVAAAAASNGSFSLSLAPGTTYAAFVNGTTLGSGPNGTYVESWRSVPGATCSVGSSSSSCYVRMVGVPQSVWVNGTIVTSGTQSPLAGTLTFLGPYPSVNTTVVATTNGAFSAQLRPGAYSLYATGAGPSQTLAVLSKVLALPSTTAAPLTVVLGSTWTDTVTVVPPTAGAAYGPVGLSVTNALGARIAFESVPFNSPLALALPTGTYVVRASSPGSFGGAGANATAQSTVTVVNGNVGTVLPLAFSTRAAVSGTLVGPASATVGAGAHAAFSFTFRNTGNVPVTVHPVGTPSYWNFSFSFSNATLSPGPAGGSLSAEVRLLVPAGTPVSHPTVTIEFETANGTVVGSVSPGPTVNVVGYYGVASGPSSVPAEVGATSALVPFYVLNTGNQPETVVAALADASRLASLGWTSGLRLSSQTAVSSGPIKDSLGTGANSTLYLVLNATSNVFVPPGTVTVSLSVLNASGSVSETTVLSVPTVAVAAGSGNGAPPVTVAGPSLGSPPNAPPDWLVPLLSFVPAIALVVGILSYRWWRTRRWTRR
jgi:dolichyl-diphosphooligosaccharide--protein glycosyltransferase